MNIEQAYELWASKVRNLKANYDTHFVYHKCIEKVRETIDTKAQPSQQNTKSTESDEPIIFDPENDEDVQTEQPISESKKRSRTRARKG